MALTIQTWWQIFGRDPERRKWFADACEAEGIPRPTRWQNGKPAGIPGEFADRAEQLALLVKRGPIDSTQQAKAAPKKSTDAAPQQKAKPGRPRKKRRG